MLSEKVFANPGNIQMKKLVILVLAAAIVSSPALAFSNYHYGDVFGQGSEIFDRNNNSSGYIGGSAYNYPRVGPYPSPGDDRYDLEGLRVEDGGDHLYVAIANSFGYSAYSSRHNQSYRLGDLFMTTESGDQYAIDIFDIANTGTTSLYQVNGNTNPIQNVSGSYYGNNTVRNMIGAFEIDPAGTANGGAQSLGSVEFAKSFAAGYETDFGGLKYANGDTYVWEFKIDKSLLGDFSSLDFQIALGCGNDFMRETYDAIPEPATVLLFSLGLAGAGLYRRRRKIA